MSISFACACGKRLQAKDEHAGRKTRCPDCGVTLVVPAGSGESPRVMPTPMAAPATPPMAMAAPVMPPEYDLAPDVSATAEAPAPPPLPPPVAVAVTDAPSTSHPPSPGFAYVPAREPWSFTLVDQYAVVARNLLLGLSAVLIGLGALAYVGGLVFFLFANRGTASVGFLDALLVIGISTLAFLIGVGLYLLFFVLPIMLFLAMLHITVDGARSLRAIRILLERRG